MDWLSEQCRRIQEQKLKQERSIRHLRQLFKAWPKVKSEPEEGKSDSQAALDREKKSDEKEDDRLTVEEKEGLLMMDKLLSKAQKARDLQKKLEEPKKPRNTQIIKQKNKNDNDALKNDKTTLECVDKELQKKLNEVENTSNIHTSKVPSVTADHTNTGGRNKAVSNIKAQCKGPNKAKPVEKVERQKISHRPQSSSGNRKVVPVHVNAPFQTNPNLMSSKLQTTYKAATSKTLAKSRSAGSTSSRGTETKGNERAPTVASRGKSVKSDDKKVKQTNIQDNQEDSSVEIDTDICHAEESSDKKNCTDDMDSLNKKFNATSLKSDQASSEDIQSLVSEGKDCEELFFLKKDGAKLSVPVRLKKLVYQNRKFRQKLYAQTVTQKVSCPDASTNFPQNLQYTFGEKDDQLTQLQARQARHISATYTSLLHMLDNLHLDHITVESDPADIYYCKKMVEHILLTFQELEQSLHTTDLRMLGNVVTPPDRPSLKLPLTQPTSMSVWYEKNILTGKHSCQTVFQYGSYKLLEKYMDRVYQVQLLQLQIDVMDTVARLLIPLLQSLDPTSSEFARVLRAGYSLMSVNRNNQPVIVMDTIQDDSTLQQED